MDNNSCMYVSLFNWLLSCYIETYRQSDGDRNAHTQPKKDGRIEPSREQLVEERGIIDKTLNTQISIS